MVKEGGRTIECIRSAVLETASLRVTLDLEEIVDSADARDFVNGAVGLLYYGTVETGQVAGRYVAEALSVSQCCEYGCDCYDLRLHRRELADSVEWRR